jgi:hypothetical protein
MAFISDPHPGRRRSVALLAAMLFSQLLFAQAENVPSRHPVYIFLKRMEVKRVIERYHDAVLPLSRREVASFLDSADRKRAELSTAEQEWLDDYLSEFQYDRTGTTKGFAYLFGNADSTESGGIAGEISNREKFLYAYTDSNVSLFTNGLLDLDARYIQGDTLGKTGSQYLQFGGRARGSVWGSLGYYIQWTNAQFWGSRELLALDPEISQSYALGTGNAQNFDFVEGYIRYDSRIVSAQIGRERVLWGTGYNEKLTLSDNPRVFDFIRLDASYKALKYTFMHGWLMGRRSVLPFMLPGDTSTVYLEPTAADKYFAAHRLELSFPSVLDVGFQEMVIYSNRAPDLAYLNPLTAIESAQRSRGERDNVFWAFDLQTHFISGLELSASFMFDDINVPDLFSDSWTNRFGWQAGLFYTDVFFIPNTSLMVEYCRIMPYVFSHGRSREGSYTSLNNLLGPRIGPNADSWFVRGDYLPLRNLMFSLGVTWERKGENIVDDLGTLIQNVGGDEFQPHRDSDPETRVFLDGKLIKRQKVHFRVSWQCVNQIYLDGVFQYDAAETVSTGERNENSQAALHLKMEF